MPRKPTDRADAAAIAGLVPDDARADVELRTRALLARNATLTLIEETREEAHLTKRDLARRAGLEESSVRRLLTSQVANPTSENVFRLLGALGVRLEAVTPSGKRVSLV